MTTASPAPSDVLEKVDILGPPGTPVTTPEVAEGFDCTQRTIYNRLESLVDDGLLETKKVGANSRVWWRPVTGNLRRNGGASDHRDSVSLQDGQFPSFTADSEMAERIREFEWAATPLGPIAEWPQELRTAVDMMLGADEAIGIYWGDDLVLLYNDHARDLIGEKHPGALGRPAREVFPEAWETLGPLHEQVMAGDGAASIREHLLPLKRSDELEDIWFDSSYNPIPGPDGSVGGVFNIAVDVTDRVRAEQDLRESNERLEVALTAAGMGTWEWDLDECTVHGDENMQSLFDLPPANAPIPVERYLGKMSPEGVTQCETVMESTFEPGEEIQDEIRLDYVDDPPRWVTWRGRAADDDPSVLRGVSFDVTERKEAELQRKERYRTLFESINEGFCIVEVLFDEDDEPVDYRFLETNPAFEALTGLSDAEGKRMRALEPDHEEHWFETYGRVAKTGESERFTNRAEHLDDRWYDVFTFPIGNTEERRVAILFDDITERKEAEMEREQALAELRESEERFRTLVDSELFGVVVWDEAIEIADANDAFLEMAGLDYQEAVGTSWRDLTPEEFYEASERHILEVEETGSGVAYEKQYYHADGSRWWGLFESRSLTDEKVVEFVVDITERKEMEEELRESEATLSAILEQLPLGVGVLNADGVYERRNDRMAEILDGDLLPSRDPEKQAEWHATDDAGDPLPPEQWPGARALRGERVTPGIEFRREQDGETRWFEVAGVPFDGPWEEPKAIGVVQEITEQKEAREAIRESEARLDAFITTTMDLVYRMSPDWSDVYSLTGDPFIEVDEQRTEQWLTEYIPEDEQERVAAAIEAAVEAKDLFDLEHEVFLSDGTRGWTRSRGVPILDDDGEIVEWFGTATDITERKEIEEELRRSEERLKAATSTAEIGIWELDLETEESRYISPSYADILGYDEVPADWTLERALDHYHPEDRERLLEYLEDGLGERTFESPVVRTDGEERWILVDSELYTDRDGDPVRAVGTMQDVTEQKHRERRDQFLLELSDRIRALESEEAIGESCTELLAEELGLDRAYFVRFFPDDEEALVGPEYHSDDLDPVSGLYPFSAFPEATRRIQDGTLVFDDTANADTLPETERQALLDLGFGAYMAVPIQTDDDHPDWGLYAVTGDPHDWTDAEVSLIEEAAERTWSAVERARAQEILNQSNQSLERLNDVSRELIDADPETVKERVAELTVDVLGVEYAALWRYDGRTGELERDSEHVASGIDLDAIRPSDVSHEKVWEMFVDDEIHVEDALDVAEGEWPSQLGNRAFVPLGRHGVVVAGSTESATFDDRQLDLVSMVASTVETLWDRAENERELERRNEELTRLDQLNTLIRGIDQVLVAADTREAIDEAVCEQLADSALYEFAWIGEFDADEDAIRPRSWAGVDSATVEDLATVRDEAGTDQDPFMTALRSRELQVVGDVTTDPQARPWREVALERGARSCLAIPLVYDDSVYGLLVVYGGTPSRKHRDTDVLSELGGTIAHAINALETRATFQADSVVELTLRSTAANEPLCRLSEETDGELEFDGLVPRDDGGATVFFTAKAATVEELSTAIEDVLGIADLECLGDCGAGTMFKARVTDPTLAGHVLDRDATIRSLRHDAGTATMVVDLPGTADVREFVEGLGREVPGLELLSRQTRQREPGQTLQAAVLDRLTPRQQEVLQLAYRSGYFELPRIQTGEDLAETLGIVPSTFAKHIRSAERNVLDVIFAVEHDRQETEAN